jgi:hypothetical protein
VVEISRFKDGTLWVCFWVAGEGGWPERVAKTLLVKAAAWPIPVSAKVLVAYGGVRSLVDGPNSG